LDIKRIHSAWIADAATFSAIEWPPVSIRAYWNLSVFDNFFFSYC